MTIFWNRVAQQYDKVIDVAEEMIDGARENLAPEGLDPERVSMADVVHLFLCSSLEELTYATST